MEDLMPLARPLIYEVSDITNLVLLKTDPPILLIEACGWASSTGWENPGLVARVNVTPPADGILEFDFVASRPTGIDMPVLTRISGQTSVADLPDWVRGVRVLAETNAVERRFPAARGPALVEGSVDDEIQSFLLPEATEPTEVELLLIDEEEGVFLSAAEGMSCRDTVLMSTDIPEFKTEWEVKCLIKNPLTGRCLTSTKLPIFYRRTSKLRLIVRVCAPNTAAIWGDVQDCLRQASLAGIVAGVLTGGNLAAAAATLRTYLVACLKEKLGQVFGDITVALRREKVTGTWKRV